MNDLMNRFPRWIFRGLLYTLLGTITLVGIAVLILQTTFVQNRLRIFLAETASSRLHATISIGHMEGNLLSDLTFGEIRLESHDHMPVLSIDELSIRYLLPKLFYKNIHVESLSVTGLRLDLEKSSDGVWNLPFLQNTSDRPKSEDERPFPYHMVINYLNLSDALITVRQEADTTSLTINRFDAGFEYDQTILLSVFESSFSFNRPHDLQASLSGDLEFDPALSDLTNVRLVIENGDMRAKLDGHCRFSKTNPEFSFSLTAPPFHISELLESFSFSGLQDAVASGTVQISGTPEKFDHDISLELDGASLIINGSSGYDMDRGFWTSLSADIRSLDLSKGGLPLGDMISGIVSTDIRVNATGLQSIKSLDATASAQLQGIVVSGIRLDRIGLSATWSHESLSIEQLTASCGQNLLNASGSFTPNTRKGNMDIALDLDQAEAVMNPLSKNYPVIFDTVKLGGKTTADISVEGSIDHPSARFFIVSDDASLLSFQSAHVDLKGIWRGLPGPDNHIEDIDLTLREVLSNQFQAKKITVKGSWGGWLENPDSVFSISVRDISNDRFQAEALDLSGKLRGKPAADDTTLDLMLLSNRIHFDEIDLQTLKMSSNLRGPVFTPSGRAVIEATDASIFGERFLKLSLAGNILPSNVHFDLSGGHENGSSTEIKGIVSNWNEDRKVLSLSKLFVATAAPWPVLTLSNTDPMRFLLQGDVVTVDDFSLSVNNAMLSLKGKLSKNEFLGLNLDVDNLEIDQIPGVWRDSSELSGIVSANFALDGPWNRPAISSDIRVSHLTGYGISQGSDLSASIETTGTMTSFHAALSTQGTSILSADGDIPLLVSLSPFSINTGPGEMKASLSTQDLKFSELPIPRIKGVEWDAVADMNLTLSGNILNPDIQGDFQVHDGQLTLSRNKLTYETIEGSILFSNDRFDIDNLLIEGDHEGRLMVAGAVYIREGYDLIADLKLNGNDFYIPFQKAITARISPDLHLSGWFKTPRLSGEVTINESRINLDRLSRQRYSEIQVVESSTPGSDSPVLVASQSSESGFLSPLTADILVRVPGNAWLKGQDVDAEISGEIAVSKQPNEPFVLTGPLNTLRGQYYFMGKTFELTQGNVEFPGLKEINPNLDIEAQTRIKSVDIIATLSGTAQEMTLDLSSDPAMEQSDIISYLVFGRATDDLGGDQAFSVEKTAMNYMGGLLAVELRDMLGGVEFIDTFSIDPSSDENGIGSMKFGKYITPELFISRSQSLSENEASYQEITYELTPSIKLETQVGKEYSNSVDLTWELDF